MLTPSNKTELIDYTVQNFNILIALLEVSDPLVLNKDFKIDEPNYIVKPWELEKNTKDLIINLFEWNIMLAEWISVNKRGENKPFFSEPKKFETLVKLNQHFIDIHEKTRLHDAVRLLKESHDLLIHQINYFTNEQLFSKNIYPWVKNETLSEYFSVTTYERYIWAMDRITIHLNSFE